MFVTAKATDTLENYQYKAVIHSDVAEAIRLIFEDLNSESYYNAVMEDTLKMQMRTSITLFGG